MKKEARDEKNGKGEGGWMRDLHIDTIGQEIITRVSE